MVYKSGLYFSECLGECLTEQINKRININFPSLIIIDGGQGQGKTTLMAHIIDDINKKRNIPECELTLGHHPQIALGGQEFTKNFNMCKAEGYPIIGYDEAGDFSRRGSISRFNAMINRRFETFRSSNMIVVLCLPNFNILDNHLFDLQIPRLLLHLRDRETTINYGNFWSYSLFGMNWVRYWHAKLPSAIRYKAYQKVTPNFLGHFQNLPDERREQLLKLSNFGKDRESKVAEIKAEGLLTSIDISQKCNRSIVWVRNKYRELRIKPIRKIDKVNYYTKEQMEQLLDHLEGLGPQGKATW